MRAFRGRRIRISPGGIRPYREEEWRDSLVIVRCGTLEVECMAGRRVRFEAGSVLHLVGLPLRALHNPGGVTTEMVAVARRHRREPRPD